jgi:hypothetical protein
MHQNGHPSCTRIIAVHINGLGHSNGLEAVISGGR